MEAGELMQFGPRPLWMSDALCHERSDMSWFPVSGPSADYEGPKAVCGRCLVRADCLAYALENRIDYGIWGGMTALDRGRLLAERDGRPVRRRARRAQPAPEVAAAVEVITSAPVASMTDIGRGPRTFGPEVSSYLPSIARPCDSLPTTARALRGDLVCPPGGHSSARKPRRSRTKTMHPPDDDALLVPSEVAAMFRVDAKTVTRWARSGKLSSIRTLGGHRRFRESEICAYFARPDEHDFE